jgi:hypothetical protein
VEFRSLGTVQVKCPHGSQYALALKIKISHPHIARRPGLSRKCRPSQIPPRIAVHNGIIRITTLGPYDCVKTGPPQDRREVPVGIEWFYCVSVVQASYSSIGLVLAAKVLRTFEQSDERLVRVLVIETSIHHAVPRPSDSAFYHILHTRMADLSNPLNILRTQACWIRHLNWLVQNIAIEIYAANKSQRVF